MTHVPDELVPRLQALEQKLSHMGFYNGALDDDWGTGVDQGLDKLFTRAGYKAPVQTAPDARPPDATLWIHVPAGYLWLQRLGDLPNLTEAGLHLLGIAELSGSANNPTLFKWRDELKAIGKHTEGFTADAVPWCGLGAGKMALDAGYGSEIPSYPLWALNWNSFGVAAKQPCLGSICTFMRDGGGHVGLYIAEDREGYYHVLGGNTSNRVSIARIAKTRLRACREPAYHTRPSTARPFVVSATGTITTNEA
jgi:uncharacterized protein (TIGR02594 family)